MRIFITGATGFIGTQLIQRLALTNHKLRCLIRETSQIHFLKNFKVELVTGDVNKKDSLLEGMHGCDWVINLANNYSYWEPNKRIYTKVNVEGTRNIMACALKTGVSKVIHISSLVVYGKPEDYPFTEESTASNILFSEYARTKFEGDSIAWHYFENHGLPLIMIYPGAVVGANDPNSTGQYIKNIMNKHMPAKVLLGSGLTYVHVKDVAEIIVRAAEMQDNIGEKYFACSQYLTVRELNDLVSKASGASLPRLSLPNWLAIACAALLTGLANVIKKPPLWNMSLDMMRSLKEGINADGSKTEKDLGISYTPIVNAVEEAIASYRREEDFFHWTGSVAIDVNVGSTKINLPIMYYRDDCFLGFFSTDYKETLALLPSQEIYPVKLPNGRAVLGVAAFNYLETSIGAYGEISIFIPCTYGRRGPRLIPLLLEGGYPGWGTFVLHLPVTTRLARDAGRAIYGFPKFIADMDFEQHPTYQRVHLAENGKQILTLTVNQRGITKRDNRPIITYSVLNDEVIKTTIPSRAMYKMELMPSSPALALGDHEIADQLRKLDISTTAFATRSYLTRSGILPAGKVLGKSDHPYTGYIGNDKEYGSLTINYDYSQGPIDLHPRIK